MAFRKQDYIKIGEEQYRIISYSGDEFSTGGQGEVHLVQKKGLKFIAKTYGHDNINYFRQQIKILKKLQKCKYVAQMIDHSEKATKFQCGKRPLTCPVLILQFCEKGDLHIFFLKQCKKLKEQGRIQFIEELVAVGLFKQILMGLQEIHARNCLHRDIKPKNLVFDSNYSIKFIDFGFSCMADEYLDEDLDSQLIEQNGYHPKQSNQSQHNEKSDIFSCGIILHDLLFWDLVKLFGKKKQQCTINSDPNNQGYSLFIEKGEGKGFFHERMKKRHEMRVLSDKVIDLFHSIFIKKTKERESIENILLRDLLGNCAGKDYVIKTLKEIQIQIQKDRAIEEEKSSRSSQQYSDGISTQSQQMQKQKRVSIHKGNNNLGNAIINTFTSIFNPKNPHSLSKQGLKAIFKEFKKQMKTALKQTIEYLKSIGVVRQKLMQSSRFYSRFVFTSKPELVIAVLTSRIQAFKKEKLAELTHRYLQGYQVDQLQSDPLCYYNHETQSIDFDLSFTKSKSMYEMEEESPEHIKVDISGKVRKRGFKYMTVDWIYGDDEYANFFKTPIQNIMGGIVLYENKQNMIALTNGQQKCLELEYEQFSMSQ